MRGARRPLCHPRALPKEPPGYPQGAGRFSFAPTDLTATPEYAITLWRNDAPEDWQMLPSKSSYGKFSDYERDRQADARGYQRTSAMFANDARGMRNDGWPHGVVIRAQEKAAEFALAARDLMRVGV